MTTRAKGGHSQTFVCEDHRLAIGISHLRFGNTRAFTTKMKPITALSNDSWVNIPHNDGLTNFQDQPKRCEGFSIGDTGRPGSRGTIRENPRSYTL